MARAECEWNSKLRNKCGVGSPDQNCATQNSRLNAFNTLTTAVGFYILPTCVCLSVVCMLYLLTCWHKLAQFPTENPFASTHSLDDNPFDDPTPTNQRTFAPPQPDRTAELDRRERELAAREQALSERQAHLQRHGRNNWPPCKLPFLLSDK